VVLSVGCCMTENILRCPPYLKAPSLFTNEDASCSEDKINNKQTPWAESASELYRPSDRRLSENLVPSFVDRGATWSI
jgi:hypothetical protein